MKTQINKIRVERGDIITGATEIKKDHKRLLHMFICQQIGQPRRSQ